MTHSSTRRMSATCQLRVASHLDVHWSRWLGNLTLSHQDDGTTTLTGTIADQTELYGLLNQIRDLGLTLISLAVSDRPRADPAHADQQGQDQAE